MKTLALLSTVTRPGAKLLEHFESVSSSVKNRTVIHRPDVRARWVLYVNRGGYFMIMQELDVKNIRRRGKQQTAWCLYNGSITGSCMWEPGGPFSSFAKSLSSSYDIGSDMVVFFSPHQQRAGMALICLWESPFGQNSQTSKPKTGG